MEQSFKNILSIYLIKDEYPSHDSIFRNIEKLKKEEIRINDKLSGFLYFGESHINEPSWLGKFFGSHFSNSIENEHGKRMKIFNSSSKAVFLITIKVQNTDKTFAIPFGYGWQFLNHGVWEERFGLKTALNIINPESLRKIDKKNMSSVPKDTSEQLTRAGIPADFGIDIEQDMLLSITGNSTDIRFGEMITGKDSLKVSIKIGLRNISEFLEICYETYQKEDYKRDFAWIDHISSIKDPKVTKKLNDELIDNIKNNKLEKTWMAVPEIIDWSRVAGFKYSSAKKYPINDDIRLTDFLESLSQEEKDKLDLNILKTKKIFCSSAINDEDVYGPWVAYNCLYSEIKDVENKKTYLLSNGEWYEIEKEFANEVADDFESLVSIKSELEMPNYSHKNENEYSEKIAQENKKFCCMDRQVIRHGGGHGQIEFCDLITTDNKIIHIKHYGQSSVLSHLFFQGLVSGELMKRDESFRSKVNEKLVKISPSHKIENPKGFLDASKYEVVFAIISESSKAFDIPFFSKVSLRNAKGKLEAFGYKVSLQKIGR